MKFNKRIKFLSLGVFLSTSLLLLSGLTMADNATKRNLSEQNLKRSMAIMDAAVSAHFKSDDMAMARFYNPYTNTSSEEIGSVWMYASSIEAVNAILKGLKAQKEIGNSSIYKDNFKRYTKLLDKLVDNLVYYQGTYELTSYTQTKTWSVYGVNRGGAKGEAEVEGIMNVYDDQMWLARELIEAYHLTNNKKYLNKAEYLTEYVLDGWDCSIGDDGKERGGITWGPGYVSKHSCSNGPIISPLVWLYEIYKNKSDDITHYYIESKDGYTRKTSQVNKADYYLDFAKRIYKWQKEKLLRNDGVYDDFMGGCTPGHPTIIKVDGVEYKQGIDCKDVVGPAYTYNSGSMLSGAIDLYRVTNDKSFLNDATDLSEKSFAYFASRNEDVKGYYSYNVKGFANWFNGVLMRAYVETYPYDNSVDKCIDSFQKNLDYGYEKYFHEGFLPTNLLVGWDENKDNNNTEGMFSFTFAAEYALLSAYELE